MRVVLMIAADCAPLEIGQRDLERRISEKGNCQAADAAAFLNALGISPKMILTSPFLRTEETGKCLMERLSGECTLETVPALMPGSGPEELMRAITQRSAEICGTEWILAVLHEQDADFIIRSLIGTDYTIPVCAGLAVGMEIICTNAKITGKLLFSRYPGEID